MIKVWAVWGALFAAFLIPDFSWAQVENSFYFYSRKPWSSARWYAIGVVRRDHVEWKGEKGIFRTRLNPRCSFDEKSFDVNRDSDEDSFEVLRSGAMILIELNPQLRSEVFEFESTDDPNCRTRLELGYRFDGSSQIRPHAFLAAQGTRYGNNEYVIYAPPIHEQSDIQMDIFFGVWNMTLPNAEPGVAKSLTMAPIVMARGEWQPRYMRRGLGFTFALEQNLATFGGVADQTLNVTSLNGGLFYEYIYPFLDGWQNRIWARIFQHQADDGTLVESIGSSNSLMFFPIATAMSNLYFGSGWHFGLEIGWGLKNQLLSTVDIDMLEFASSIGYRLTTNTVWIIEARARRFNASDSQPEWIYSGATGVRLEL